MHPELGSAGPDEHHDVGPMSVSPSPQELAADLRARAIASMLRAASCVLALLFLLRLLLALGPLSSGPVLVTLRLCDALVGQALFAVLAICLLALSLLIDEESPRGRRLAHHVSSLALPVAIGYLLLIPLYGSALLARSSSEARSLEQSLQTTLVRLQQARGRVLQASSSADLTRILTSLPMGAPPLTRFGADLDSQRSTLLDFFNQARRLLTTRLQGMHQQLGIRVVRDTGLYALACLALAMLFQRSARIVVPRPLRQPGDGGASRPRSARATLEHDFEMLLADLPPSDETVTSSPAGGPGDRAPAADGVPSVPRIDR